MRFQDRTAIVTGGASGIGLAAAERLLAEGAKVCIWDLEAVEARDNLLSIIVDQSDEAAIDRAVSQTLSAFGRIDILIVSAGITGPNATVVKYPVEDWRRVMEVNVNGTFLCNRAVAPHMVAQGYGRIVNLASIAGKEGNPNAAAYSTSKAAVIGLTKSLGKELATTGVTVNCITPAAVRTPIFDQMSEAHIEFMLSKIPMGRFGTVEENAALILWLASEECSFSTGAVFDISGGRATY